MRVSVMCVLAAMLATSAAANPLEELRVRAATALRDAQACCNRVDDGAVPGEALSPCRQDLRRVEDRYAASLRLLEQEDFAFAREALEETIEAARVTFEHCRGIGPRGP